MPVSAIGQKTDTGYYMSFAIYDEGKHTWRKPTAEEAQK